MNIVGWFRAFWPHDGARRAALAQYATLGDEFLADVALRGAIWQAAPAGLSPYDAGVFEGRRQVALEILRVKHADPMRLLDIVDNQERQHGRK